MFRRYLPPTTHCHLERSEGSAFRLSPIHALSLNAFNPCSPLPFNIPTFKPSYDPHLFSPCSPSVQLRAKREQTIPLFSGFYKRQVSQLLSIHILTNAQGGVRSRTKISSLPFSVIAAIPFRMIFFAHPHPLTPIESYSCKKQGRVGTSLKPNLRWPFRGSSLPLLERGVVT